MSPSHTSPLERVLIVDDEENVLNGLKRHLHKIYDIETATSGVQAIKLIKETKPFAVIVCDMRMPHMNGLQLLEHLQELTPNSIRIMLTGNADQQTAVDAVNRGNVFRFLNKPSSIDEIRQGIDAGIHQYRLERAEQELLEQTLAGSVKLLVEILSAANPEAFAKAERVRRWAKAMAIHLNIKTRWRLDLAALLAPIGLICIPPEVMLKLSRGESLSEVEKTIIADAPEVGAKLLRNIPRLSGVADLVANYRQDIPHPEKEGSEITFNEAETEAHLLRILYDLEEISHGANPTDDDFKRLNENAKYYDWALLHEVREALLTTDPSGPLEDRITKAITASMLLPGDILLENIETDEGRLILITGSRLSAVQVERIKSFAKIYTLKEPIHVSRTTKHVFE